MEEGERKIFLKNMRRFKFDALKKTDLMKKIVKKCTNLTPRTMKCSRCGYINGSALAFSLDAFIMVVANKNCIACLLIAN